MQKVSRWHCPPLWLGNRWEVEGREMCAIIEGGVGRGDQNHIFFWYLFGYFYEKSIGSV